MAGGHNKLTHAQAIQRIEQKHPRKYGFERMVYKDITSPITLFCNAHQKYFDIPFIRAVDGNGCPTCISEVRSSIVRGSKEDFVRGAIAEHGDLYEYSESEYIDAKTKVKIFCKKHQSYFYQTPNSHLRGCGCPLCGKERASYNKIDESRLAFVDRANAVSPQYDYSKVVYKGSYVKVEVICPTHKSFWIRPSNILQGKGCKACAAASTAKLKKDEAARTFVSRALAHPAHADRIYSYAKSVYMGSKSKLVVSCLLHGDFSIAPGNHLSGRGCPDCGEHGYRKNKPGKLYVLVCDGLTKVGITNHSAQTRCNHVSHHYGSKFNVKFEASFEDGEIPLAIETKILSELRGNCAQPEMYFVGGTECFFGVDVNALVEKITTQIREHSDVPNNQTI